MRKLLWITLLMIVAVSSAKAQKTSPQKTKKDTTNNKKAEAVVLLELSPPFNAGQLQAAYRKMVKKHHPDLHQGCLNAEEKIKHINQAYALLKSKMAA